MFPAGDLEIERGAADGLGEIVAEIVHETHGWEIRGGVGCATAGRNGGWVLAMGKDWRSGGRR
jgi:hypothetical protein